MPQQRICLNMIVKNEADRINRALDSTVGHVTSVVVYDTGSGDATTDLISEHCNKHHIPCFIRHGVFENFSQARNEALKAARKFAETARVDYFLLMDADMELVVAGPLPKLTKESYTLLQRQGELAYHNVRLLSAKSQATYHGVTHEYLGADYQETLFDTTWWFRDHADGANRGDKMERDIRLLEEDLVRDPNNGRSLFYLAQTLRDAGRHAEAIVHYKRRIEIGGWDEEIWYSKFAIARSYRALGHTEQFIDAALEAYNSRPSRAEPLYDLARFYREQPDKQQVGWLFAQAGSKMPMTYDKLFVESNVYRWGFAEEMSILGAYNERTKPLGFQFADLLSLSKYVPDYVRETARSNLYHYLKPLKEMAPSFTCSRIPDLNPDSRFVNSNPSIAMIDGELWGIVRTVSYRIREDGTYDYNGLDAIRTTNFLTKFEVDPFELTGPTVEIQRPNNLPSPKFTGVLDIEDLRLFPSADGAIWAIGCMLEQNPSAWREQYFIMINPDTGEVPYYTHIEPDLPTGKENQKNWMPILEPGRVQFMYRPGTAISIAGDFVVTNENSSAVDQFAGGGQVLPFDAGYLAIIHEARPDPFTGKRYYQHRFVYFNEKLELTKVSRPFVFFDKQIEFAAGLAKGPFGSHIYVSFGVLDREAWVGSISANEVREMIWHP